METPCNVVDNLPTQDEVEDMAAQVASDTAAQVASAPPAPAPPAPPTPPVFVVDCNNTASNVYVPLRCRQGATDYSTLALTHFLESPHFNTFTSVATSPGGEYIATGDDHGHVEESTLPRLQY